MSQKPAAKSTEVAKKTKKFVKKKKKKLTKIQTEQELISEPEPVKIQAKFEGNFPILKAHIEKTYGTKITYNYGPNKSKIINKKPKSPVRRGGHSGCTKYLPPQDEDGIWYDPYLFKMGHGKFSQEVIDRWEKYGEAVPLEE